MALEASSVQSQSIADILDWSFQRALDEIADAHLGTKHIRLRPSPGLDAATKLLVQQRQVAQDLMWVVLGSPDATEVDKATARKQFLKASNAVKSAAMRRREISELALFRDVEDKQGDSKKFWSKYKLLKGTTRTDKAPPPCRRERRGGGRDRPSGGAQSMAQFQCIHRLCESRRHARGGQVR